VEAYICACEYFLPLLHVRPLLPHFAKRRKKQKRKRKKLYVN